MSLALGDPIGRFGGGGPLTFTVSEQVALANSEIFTPVTNLVNVTTGDPHETVNLGAGDWLMQVYSDADDWMRYRSFGVSSADGDQVKQADGPYSYPIGLFLEFTLTADRDVTIIARSHGGTRYVRPGDLFTFVKKAAP